MQKLADALRTAEEARFISKEQREQLSAHFQAAGLFPPSDGAALAGFADSLSAPRDGDPVAATEESEAPRFIRGFHDVLITIGIVVLLAGLGAVVPPFVMIVPVIVLAEILVKRQRLALPAFVLTIAATLYIPHLLAPLLGISVPGSSPILTFALLMAGLGAFYWRYRVPVALAVMILAAGGLAFFSLLAAMGQHYETGLAANGLIVSLIAFVFALGLFAVALWFDMRDPSRVTRRSDVAFWLHLGAAPALLYSTFLLMAALDGAGLSLGDFIQNRPAAALAPIVVMMLVGVVIDRRAFVTSGLLSLGIAIAVLMQNSQIEVSSTAALAAIAVGVIVLSLGVGWQGLRRLVVPLFPAGLRRRVPAAG